MENWITRRNPHERPVDANTRRNPSRRSRFSISGVVSVFAVLMIVPITPADAYCTSGITRWSGSSYTLHMSPLIAGWNQTSVTNANAQWDNGNISGSTLNYNTPLYNQGMVYSYQGSFANFSQIGLPDSWPGATSNSLGTTHASSWMRFNNTFTWNTSGTMNGTLKQADVRTIAVHEMGHASGLNHPDVCGAMDSAEIASAMNPNWTQKWTVNSDDKAGIALRY